VENQTIIPFSARIDRLAAQLQMGLKEVAPWIGISPAMLFAYKSGKNPISKKAWRKLEEAEIRDGIAMPHPVDLVYKGRLPLVAESKRLYGGDPATRRECELYFKAYLDAAEESGDPNAFPFIMRLLKKDLSVSEWTRDDHRSD